MKKIQRGDRNLNWMTPQEVISGLFLFFFILACLILNIKGSISHSNLCLFFVIGLVIINACLFILGKNVKIVPLATLSVLILIMGTAYSVDESNPDLDGYLRAYTYLQDYGISHLNEVNVDTNGGSDTGFLILMYCFIIVGFSYNWFVSFLALISSLLIYKGTKKLNGNYCLILACYILMSYTYDVFQIRFFFAYSIILYGIHYLLQEKRNIKRYLVCVLIAICFHFSAIFFFLLLVTPKFLSKYYKIIIGFFILLFVLAYLNLGGVMLIIASLVPAERLIRYASQGIEISIFTAAFVSIIVLVMIMMTGNLHKKRKNSLTEYLLRLNILCSIVIPVVPISLDFERFLRPVLIVDYAVFSSPLLSNKRRKLFCLVFFVLSVLRVSVMINSFTKDIMTNNYFMDFIFQ